MFRERKTLEMILFAFALQSIQYVDKPHRLQWQIKLSTRASCAVICRPELDLSF